MGAKPKAFESNNHVKPTVLEFANYVDPIKQQTKREQLYTLIVKREKRKKKNTNNQSPTTIQP
jgi:hypothetical protein